MAVAALVLGIAALVLSFVPGISFISPICAIVGVVLGAIARKKAKEAGQPTGMATAGMVLSIITLVLSLIVVVLCGIVLGGTAAVLGSLGLF